MTVQENIPLAPYTTYRIGGQARYFVVCKSEEDILNAVRWAKEKDLPYFVLGGGSNLLISDKGYSGLIIHLEVSHHTIDGLRISAQAGVPMQALVEETTSNGLKGLEWAGGLPGQLGGAIRGNAGAFGGEINDVIKSVRVLTPSGKVKNFSRRKCGFKYRSSIFKRDPGYIILSAELKFQNGEAKELLKLAAEKVEWRRTKHPMDKGNCGSYFTGTPLHELPQGLLEKHPDIKNAIRDGNVATAYFIDQCGFKNKRIGGAEVSDRHPNFLVNQTGSACSEHVLMLASMVKSRVLHDFGVILEEEPEYLS